jgi:hypothetical protein
MLARRLTTILPAMTLAEAVETTRIHHVAGLTGERSALITTRPFRAPHRTISDAGLIGGGQVPMPGEVSLAHNGVPVLEELPKCCVIGFGSPRKHVAHRIDMSQLAVLAMRTESAYPVKTKLES